MMFSWLALAIAASLPPAGQAEHPDLVILHFNDFHGQVRPLAGRRERGGFAALAAFIDRTRAEGRERGFPVLVTDGGDWFQGTPEGNETTGRLPLTLMHRAGLGVAVLGNHEFDFGAARTKELVALARHPVLGANVAKRGTKQHCGWVKPFHVVCVRGVRIGIIGLVTQRTKETSTGPFGDHDFGDEIEWLGRILPRARAAADQLVLLTHVGLDRDVKLARRFPELRLILGGHSHTSLKRPVRVGTTTIVQTGGKSSEIYRLDLRVDPTMRTLEILRARNRPLDPRKVPPSPELVRWIAGATADIRARWDRPLGELRAPLAGGRGLVGSTSGGSLVADLMRASAGARIGIMNKGGIRARLPAGPMTRRMAYELLPFTNTVVSMDLTGAEVERVLQEGLARAKRPFDVSGLRYEVRASTAGLRVAALRLDDGAPLDPRATYRVATNSFLAGGGDGAKTFRVGRKRQDHGKLLRELLVEHVEKRGAITPPADARIAIRVRK